MDYMIMMDGEMVLAEETKKDPACSKQRLGAFAGMKDKEDEDHDE